MKALKGLTTERGCPFSLLLIGFEQIDSQPWRASHHVIADPPQPAHFCQFSAFPSLDRICRSFLFLTQEKELSTIFLML